MSSGSARVTRTKFDRVDAVAGFLLGASATYRLTRLVVEDTITEGLRNRIWDRYPPESTKLGYLISCPHCVSIYAAATVSALILASVTPPSRRHHGPLVAKMLLGTLALSGAVSLYHDHVEKTRR